MNEWQNDFKSIVDFIPAEKRKYRRIASSPHRISMLRGVLIQKTWWKYLIQTMRKEKRKTNNLIDTNDESIQWTTSLLPQESNLKLIILNGYFLVGILQLR